MVNRYRFLTGKFAIKSMMLPVVLVFGSIFLFAISALADPPVGTFYYPPYNVPPGPPPNYNQVDSVYFAGEPELPLPPPDSGGVFIWVDSQGTWNIANHIYSKGNSLEQFHGSILAKLETPPTPGVNIFTAGFELFGDPSEGTCYLQNDRWGWYDWGSGLYEIWWDVSTREWKQGDGDLNDFMIMSIDGCAIDFNVWSSGHGDPFAADQIYLGASKTRLSDVPEFEDTYPGIYDPYQEQAGDDPTGDPNITIFTAMEGSGGTFNVDGLISPGQTYPCGPIKGQSYGDRFSGTFVYEGDGIEFSSVCAGLQGPGLKVDDVEIPPIADDTTDLLIEICGGTQVWSLIEEFSPYEDINIFGYYSDPGIGDERIVEFIGPDAAGQVDTTWIIPGISAGLWLHNDSNGDQSHNGGEALLFSERDLTQGSGDNNHQWFLVYDVSAYKGTGVTYDFFCPTQDYSFTGDFDYLIFIDDDNSTANFDHNDMMVGMLCLNAPEIVCPADIDVECGDSVHPDNTGYAIATSSCGDVPEIAYSDVEGDYIITRTWTATDDCGVSSSCEQIITLVDTTPPSIGCPDDMAVQCIDDIPAPDINSVTASDECDASPLVTFIDDISDGNFCPEVVTRTYRATDASGNYAECQQVFTVMDDTPPEISCPVNVTVECDESTDPSSTGFATAGDNCGDPELTYSDSQADNVITRTWTATDGCGNTDQCVQTITIVDTTPPTITCPDDISVQCSADIPLPETDGVLAADNCDPSPVITHIDDLSDGNSCPENISRTYRATDSAGNFAECVQIITVMDETPPTISCPTNVTIDCGETADPSNTGFATADDNCGEVTVDYTDNQVDNIINRTWTATDGCGNTDQCVQSITLEDTTPPAITCPDDFSLQCITDLPPADIDGVIASDDCDPNPVITHEGDVSDGNICPETITRTFRATDAAGNYVECDQVITIHDDVGPDITCPADIAIDCDESTDPENTGYANADDNCDTAPELSYSDVTGEDQIARTWIAVDECGNYSVECVQIITINENLPPVIECPLDAVVVIVDDLEAEICFNDIPFYDPDNEIATIEVNGVLMSGSDICFVPEDWGINTVTVIVTDACGAQTSCEFTVIVGACIFLPGDANVDGEVNVADVVDILNYLKGQGPLPGGECDCTPDVPTVPFYGAADVNGSCAVNVADVVFLYDYLRGTETALLYCPLCPPTEGWLPPLLGGIPGGDLPSFEMLKNPLIK